jgi:hypothetical protein
VHRSKEIMLLLALLLSAMAFVLWYVVDRRAKLQTQPADTDRPIGPVP